MPRPRPTKVQLWTERFERFRLANVSLTQFCRDEHVSLSSFYQWRKRIVANAVAKASDQRRVVTELSTDRSVAAETDRSSVRITVEAAGTVVRCHCDSLQAVEAVLSWASRQRDSAFKQLVVRN